MTDIAIDAGHKPAADLVQKAIRLTYGQMMLGAIFGASTGGMFLIGFAMALGAGDVQLGILSSLPMFCVVFQLLSAYLIERGMSRKRITVIAAFVAPLCWLLIGAIPFGAERMPAAWRLGVLIAVVMLVTVVNQFAGNARSSWIGELIPADRRARFFGLCAMFAGLVGALFAMGEGRLLDFVENRGLLAFAGLFFFGALFGLIAAGLNLPQPDCRAQRSEGRFIDSVLAVRHNKPLMRLLATVMIMNTGQICSPFVSAYSLRDVGMSYFGLGCVNAVFIVLSLAFSPLWGRVIDKVGGRPVLIAGLALIAPCGLVWIFVPPGRPDLAYRLLPVSNILSGIMSAAIGVSLSTMIYKMTVPKGRAVQFAFYGILATLAAAPMPMIGGWLVSTLQAQGFDVDLRVTFYIWIVSMVLAALMARSIPEPGSTPTRVLVFDHIPQWLTSLPGMVFEVPAQVLDYLKRGGDEK